MPSEFALIDHHFRRPTRHTALGIGDDGALVRPTPGCELVISTDMLVAGTHFLASADATDLGWKTLAVNLSDMAAMGAQPRWALLAAALPTATESWIEKFAQGFFACAGQFKVDVIGGDTTKGPRNFCVTILGEVPQGAALLRSGARPGDEIWVSGTPGRAALGLAHLQQQISPPEPVRTDCLAALHRPQPRVALGLALQGLASAAIDISDGLLADLGHILKASGVAATLTLPSLPAIPFLPTLPSTSPPHVQEPGTDSQVISAPTAVPPAPTFVRDCYLAGGDDYELLFTVPPSHHPQVLELAQQLDLPLTCLGLIAPGPAGALQVLDATGGIIETTRHGYDHFT